jgi:NAD+ synthase (glutamine-hydrolysing)
MHVLPGNIQANTNNILAQIAYAKHEGYDLVVFPELAVTGYLLGDRFEDVDFLRDIMQANNRICEATTSITAVWGSIVTYFDKRAEDGRVMRFNAACIAHNGEWVSNGTLRGFVPKSNLPKYRMFDDARQFTSSLLLAAEMQVDINMLLRPFTVIVADEHYHIGVTVCEDLWEDDYPTKPSEIYAEHGVDLILNLSCSPWTAGKSKARYNMLKKRAAHAKCPILYVNAEGLQNNVKNLIWFDGGSMAVDEFGHLIWQAPQHTSGQFELELDTEPNLISEIHDAMIAAMRQFYGPSSPFKKVIIGLSGGVDSAVAAAMITKAVGKEKVLCFNMPTRHNSKRTQILAHWCAARLGVEYRVVNIQELYESHIALAKAAGYTDFSSPQAKLSLENVQARIRAASTLALFAQLESGAFTCNGNKTEMALNYFTLYGDGAGAAAFLADLWKGQIYQLAQYINDCAGDNVIPQGIINIVPSAELSDDQDVNKGKGDPIFYPYHDLLLQAFTEKRWGAAHVLRLASQSITVLEEALGCAPGTISKYFKTREAFVHNLEWVWRSYNSEFKRAQTPPVFICSRRAFGFDRRDTIGPNPFTQEYLSLKENFLCNDRVNDPRDL